VFVWEIVTESGWREIHWQQLEEQQERDKEQESDRDGGGESKKQHEHHGEGETGFTPQAKMSAAASGLLVLAGHEVGLETPIGQ
jgi:hypothetical protein